MKQFDAWWFPDNEFAIPEIMRVANRRRDDRLTYQYHKYEAAVRYCRERRVAVDAGAHVGLWSYWMVQDFAELHAFEPSPDAQLCWLRNIAFVGRAHLHLAALGAAAASAGLIRTRANSGNVSLAPNGTGIRVQPLDALNLQDVDFLKIDCEGYDAFVVEGALQTIVRCRPVIVVEQKPGTAQRYGRGETDAVRLLEAIGARAVQNIGGDYIVVW